MPDIISRNIHVSNLGELNLDSFGRLRVSSPFTIFAHQNQYDIGGTNLWENTLTGGGSAVHLPNESSAAMIVGTTSGDKVVRQTHAYFRYQPGKSLNIIATGVMQPKTNVRQRIGYFDASNGLFFEHDGLNMKVVLRSYISGTVVNTAVNQADWNVDRMDGSGPSGITLDLTKAQIFFIDLQWLGVGRVRLGFFISGVLYYCHEMLAANVIPSVYMTTANLPVRLEIENTGTTSSATTLKQICVSVTSEAGYELDGQSYSTGNGTSAISVSTRRPILSIRPALLFNSIPNRTIVIPKHYDIVNIGNAAVYYEIVYRGTLSGASFSAVTGSIVEFDVAATTIAGGDVIETGYVGSGGTGSSKSNIGLSANFVPRQILTLNAAGDAADVFSIVVTSITGTNPVHGSLVWSELRS